MESTTESIGLLAAQDGEDINAAPPTLDDPDRTFAESRLVRALDMRLLPMVVIIFVMN